jgi:RNA polymerase sigma-70 factor (TIGR02960 family)
MISGLDQPTLPPWTSAQTRPSAPPVANRCLNALRDSGRRPRQEPLLPPFPTEPTRHNEPVRLEPYPDVLLDGLPDLGVGPAAQYEAKEAIALAFVAAVQHLPPRQRAALVLRDVLGFRAAEVAEMLGTSETSVNSALQRARATMAARLPRRDREHAALPRSPRERELVERFAAAYSSDDVDGVVTLLTDDAWLTMPPATHEYQGHADIAEFLAASARYRDGRHFQLIPVRANGQPAFGCYLPDPHTLVRHASGIVVLTLAGDRISAITRFVDSTVMSPFGLPRTLA